ncbi:MAG: hypothetical protein ACOYXB_17360 [Bacteroidota bacterium]
MLKIIIISAILIGFVFLGLGIRLLFDRNATVRGSSCQASGALEEKGISCGCGGGSCGVRSEE